MLVINFTSIGYIQKTMTGTLLTITIFLILLTAKQLLDITQLVACRDCLHRKQIKNAACISNTQFKLRDGKKTTDFALWQRYSETQGWINL
jgi:hypothetical protein